MYGHATASEPSQSQSIRLIDLNRIQVYEAGAMLVTFLAHPGHSEGDEERRSQLYGALCAFMLQAKMLR
jgi:hypothetical protein